MNLYYDQLNKIALNSLSLIRLLHTMYSDTKQHYSLNPQLRSSFYSGTKQVPSAVSSHVPMYLKLFPLLVK